MALPSVNLVMGPQTTQKRRFSRYIQ
jgi:hypothetical protein